MSEPIVLATHAGPLTTVTLAVALEAASLASAESPTHLAAVARDAELWPIVDMLAALPTGTMGAGLSLMAMSTPTLPKGLAAFALLSVPAGCKLWRAARVAEQALAKYVES